MVFEGAGKRARLAVRVKPRSSVTDVVGFEDGVLVVRVNAPPIEGRANRAVVELVARLLGVGRSRVAIESGEKSRDKKLVVEGLSQSEVDSILEEV